MKFGRVSATLSCNYSLLCILLLDVLKLSVVEYDNGYCKKCCKRYYYLKSFLLGITYKTECC